MLDREIQHGLPRIFPPTLILLKQAVLKPNSSITDPTKASYLYHSTAQESDQIPNKTEEYSSTAPPLSSSKSAVLKTNSNLTDTDITKASPPHSSSTAQSSLDPAWQASHSSVMKTAKKPQGNSPVIPIPHSYASSHTSHPPQLTGTTQLPKEQYQHKTIQDNTRQYKTSQVERKKKKSKESKKPPGLSNNLPFIPQFSYSTLLIPHLLNSTLISHPSPHLPIPLYSSSLYHPSFLSPLHSPLVTHPPFLSSIPLLHLTVRLS